MSWWQGGLTAIAGGVVGGGFALVATKMSEGAENTRAEAAQLLRIGEMRAERLENSYKFLFRGLTIKIQLDYLVISLPNLDSARLADAMQQFDRQVRDFHADVHLALIEPGSDGVFRTYMVFVRSVQELFRALQAISMTREASQAGAEREKILALHRTVVRRQLEVIGLIRGQLASLRGVKLDLPKVKTSSESAST